MRMIERAEITAGMMIASNVPENDAPLWAAGTTYADGARVIANHRVYESIQGGNIGHDPVADTASEWWVDTGATNRWRAFDGALSPPTSQAGDISYTISITKRLDSIAFFGLIGQQLTVTVKDAGGVVQYSRVIELASQREIAGWWDYFFAPFEINESQVFWDAPLFVGYTLEIFIEGSATAVSEILIGSNIYLGETLVDTTLGFRDFSVKERDAWGGWSIVERGYSRTVDFRFTIPQEDVNRVFRAVTRNRAKMAVFDSGPNAGQVPITLLGFINEDGISIPITTNICFATLTVEGITEEI